MKLVMKTIKRVVFEVTSDEMSKKGFDAIWDNIRAEYPESAYDLYITESTSEKDVVFFELTPRPIGS